MKIRFIDEYSSDAGGRLGRHVEHDPRSRAYALSEDLLPSTYTSAVHTVRIPVLDQGDLGSCTGNAAEAFTGTDPLYDAIPATVKARPTGDAGADETQAVALYSAATRLDNVQGVYPPTDTGSTGVAVAKAAQKAGLISGYQHAFSLDSALKALAVSPLIVGVNWYEGFDTPDANGLVRSADPCVAAMSSWSTRSTQRRSSSVAATLGASGTGSTASSGSPSTTSAGSSTRTATQPCSCPSPARPPRRLRRR